MPFACYIMRLHLFGYSAGIEYRPVLLSHLSMRYICLNILNLTAVSDVKRLTAAFYQPQLGLRIESLAKRENNCWT